MFFLDQTQHFQLAFYQPSLDLIDVKITPVFGIWLNMFFKVIDISAETTYQKDENRQSISVVQTICVIEKLMPISEITTYSKGNMQE